MRLPTLYLIRVETYSGPLIRRIRNDHEVKDRQRRVYIHIVMIRVLNSSGETYKGFERKTLRRKRGHKTGRLRPKNPEKFETRDTDVSVWWSENDPKGRDVASDF